MNTIIIYDTVECSMAYICMLISEEQLHQGGYKGLL